MRDIAFCAIIKDEARYLDEWLAYHYLIGVEHFYITDDNSTDNIQEVLQKWIKKGLVTYMKVDEFLRTSSVRQIISNLTYCDVLKDSWRYLGFLDIDEFFVPPNGNIVDFLNTIPEEIASIYIRWVFFGLSETSEGFLTERCLNHSNYFAGNGKSIVNPRNVAINVKTNPHMFHPAPGTKILDFDFSPAQWSEDLSFFKDIPITAENASLPRINHYFGKSQREIEAKQKRGRFNANKNVYSVHNFYEKKLFPETFFSLPDFSNNISHIIGILENEFPDSTVKKGLSFLHGEELIAGAKTLASPPPQTPQYIVSLTSYGKRLQTTAPIAIASILCGNTLPDRIILWVSKEDKVPMQDLEKKGLEIRCCENLGPYTKLIPALHEFSNDYIITADDDLLYPKNWLEQIMEYHKAHPNKIICHRVHEIRVDCEHNLLPYNNWNWCAEPQEHERIFPTGCGGILYPPHCLHKDVLDKNLFMKLTPKNDDVWYWAMALINGSSYIVIKNGYSNSIIDIGAQDSALKNSNVDEGRNDQQLLAVIENYPQLKEIINKIKPFDSVYFEMAKNAHFDFELPVMKYPEEKGLISVIVPIYNSEIYLRECLDSLLAQTFKNWEAILVNDGSTDGCEKIINEYMERDSRFKTIHKENGGLLLARKTGLENSRGEYIANLDSDDTYEQNFLEKMLKKITETNVDFVWSKISGVNDNSYNWSENKVENALSIYDLEGIRAFLWNKLIKRNIYEKVKFINKHIVWGEDPIQTIQIIYHSNNAAFVSETFYNYRIDSTVSTSKTTNLINEEKSKIHKIMSPIAWIKILENLFGNSLPFNEKLDSVIRKAIWFYNKFDKETRVKYGIDGFISGQSE
ncbi:MAG: glycosyltransferase [Fibromonadales bacterium]|nr:glycosyltransferase [Fibromonadales bacterium]